MNGYNKKNEMEVMEAKRVGLPLFRIAICKNYYELVGVVWFLLLLGNCPRGGAIGFGQKRASETVVTKNFELLTFHHRDNMVRPQVSFVHLE